MLMMWEDRGNVGHIRESVSVSLTEHMGLRSGSANSVCVCVCVPDVFVRPGKLLVHHALSSSYSDWMHKLQE